MNKETIDYALSKLNEAFQNIKPDAIELGSEYVDYMVFKAIFSAALLFTMCTILLVTTLLILLRLSKILKYETPYYEKLYSRDADVKYSIIGIIIGFFGLIFLVIFIGSLYDAVVAYNYPVMYTIEQLIK